MSQPTGFALIGCGGIGVLRAEAVTRTPGAKLAVVADVRPDAAANAAKKFNAAADTPESAVRRDDVQVVLVSTPPHVHRDIVLEALAAGKHVICEKPLANTLADATTMCDAADRAGVLLKTGFNHRYFESMQFAKRMLDRGDLGEVRIVRAYAGHPGGKEFGHDWVHEGAVTGGGSMVDNGIHILDLTRFFIGDVDRAVGYATNLIWDFPDAEDNGFGLFRSESGAVAYVNASWTEWRGYKFVVEVVGTKGYVRASYPPMLAEWGTSPEKGVRSKKHYELFPRFQINERLRGWQWTIVESFVKEHRDFLDGIRDGKQVAPTGRDGLRAMQMADAVYRSSREGREVRF